MLGSESSLSHCARQDVTLLVEADAQYDGGHNLAASLHHLVTLVEVTD